MTLHIPPAKRTASKYTPPAQKEALQNLKKEDLEKIIPMNLHVTVQIKRDIKIAAARRGVTQSELILTLFKEWQAKND